MKYLKIKVLAAVLFTASIVVGTTVTYNQKHAVEDQPTITLTESNHVMLDGPVDEASVTALLVELSKLLLARKGNSPIYVVLNTPGGSVDAGHRAYEFIKGYKGIHTVTINGYSMGAILAQLVPGKRYMVETGTMMFHRMTMGVPGRGTPDQMATRVAKAAEMERSVEVKVALRTGKPVAELRALFNAELYLSAAAAVQGNFADEVIILKCSKELIDKKVSKLVEMPFMPPMATEVSACPLLN
jgi:ATP-dependent Clp protease protease subunit